MDLLSDFSTKRAEYDAMLETLPSNVRQRVEQKILEDENLFLEAVKQSAPSLEPSFWAKQQCSRCNGKGIIVIHTPGKTVTCTCSQKRFLMWLKDFRVSYNTSKGR